MEKTLLIGPTQERGQLLTIKVDKTVVTLQRSDGSTALAIPIMAWSDVNAAVVQMVTQMNDKPIGANET